MKMETFLRLPPLSPLSPVIPGIVVDDDDVTNDERRVDDVFIATYWISLFVVVVVVVVCKILRWQLDASSHHILVLVSLGQRVPQRIRSRIITTKTTLRTRFNTTNRRPHHHLILLTCAFTQCEEKVCCVLSFVPLFDIFVI